VRAPLARLALAVSLGIGLAFGLGGCPRRPLSFGPRGEITDPEELLAALRARSTNLLRLQAEASFSGKSDRGSGSTRGLIAAARPASLKLELDDFFGNPAAILTTNGTLLGIYTAQNGIYAEGPPSPENLARLFPIALPFSEVVDLLFGDPRPLSSVPARFFVDRELRSYALLFEGAGGAQRIDLDTETLAPVRVRVEGSDPYEARFRDPESGSGLRLPTRVDIEAPTGRVSVTYLSPEVNPALPPDLFVPVAPLGAKRLELSGK